MSRKEHISFQPRQIITLGKKNHSIVIVYLHDIYHQHTAVISQEISDAELLKQRKYEIFSYSLVISLEITRENNKRICFLVSYL